MNDLFSEELDRIGEKGLLRTSREFEACDGRTVTQNGKKYLLFCSNDYLGLSMDGRIKAAVASAVEKYGFGSGGSRLISGTRSPHIALEKAISGFLGTGSALLFNTGYSANTGIIPAIAGKGDVIIADKLNHASMVDGCLLSGAGFTRYPHLDMKALERELAGSAKARKRWIVTDGLFSMDGDLAPLDVICGLAKKYRAGVYVDDAHAFGVLGTNGRGTPSLFGVEGKIDLLVGTLGKAAGGTGAFVAGSKKATDLILNKARSFIFSTAMPPSSAAGNLRAVEILSESDAKRREFLEAARAFNAAVDTPHVARRPESYIIPLVVGDPGNALAAARGFWEKGIFIQAVRPPAVPRGSARLRLTLSASQTVADRNAVIEVIRSMFGENGKFLQPGESHNA